MNKWIIGVIGFVVGLGGGFAAGYFVRKKTEVQFEEVTEEELARVIAEDEKKEDKPKHEEDILEDKKPSDTMKQIDTQKTQYWQKWNDGKDTSEYLRQSDAPKNEEIVTTDDMDIPDDPELDMDEEDEDLRHREKVEKSDESEYNYWKSFKDGEYDTMTLAWFSGDDVTVDEDTFPIGNPLRYLGFLPKDVFGKTKDDTIYMKNNEFKVVYEIVKYDTSYDAKVHEEEYGGDDT